MSFWRGAGGALAGAWSAGGASPLAAKVLAWGVTILAFLPPK